MRAQDSISGGAGRDTLSYLGRTTLGGIKIDTLNDGLFNDGQSGEDRVFPDIEQVAGTNFDDTIFVPNQTNSGRVPHGLLSGAGGNDTLFGSGLADTLNGGAGLDTLTGGLGDDLLEGRENTRRSCGWCCADPMGIGHRERGGNAPPSVVQRPSMSRLHRHVSGDAAVRSVTPRLHLVGAMCNHGVTHRSQEVLLHGH